MSGLRMARDLRRVLLATAVLAGGDAGGVLERFVDARFGRVPAATVP